MSMVGGLRSAAIQLVRRGSREISWVPDWMGLGNNLYQWLWAYEGVREQRDRRVLLPEKHALWGEVFPQARRKVLVSRSQVRVFDQRVTPWLQPDEPSHDAQGRYSPPLLNEFIGDLLLPESGLKSTDHFVINVRRGDYYSVPRYRYQFGMPVERYLRVAMERAIASGGAPRVIHMVSDDPDWCRDHLGWLDEIAPVVYPAAGRTALSDLREVAGAQRLIMTNSTFSFWAGYIGACLHGPQHRVIAPAFFRRDLEQGSSHLLKEWTAVEDVPGGWELADHE